MEILLAQKLSATAGGPQSTPPEVKVGRRSSAGGSFASDGTESERVGKVTCERARSLLERAVGGQNVRRSQREAVEASLYQALRKSDSEHVHQRLEVRGLMVIREPRVCFFS